MDKTVKPPRKKRERNSGMLDTEKAREYARRRTANRAKRLHEIYIEDQERWKDILPSS